MKKTTILALVTLMFVSHALLAQKDKPSPVQVNKAKKLKSDYPEDDLVILTKETLISFERNNKTGKVEVIEENNTTYMAIASRADSGYSTGYDNESEIEKLILYNGKNKKIYWDLKDEAYSSSSIFHNDYRVRYGSLTLPTQGFTRRVNEVKRYKDVKYFTSHYFAESSPIINGSVIFTVPQWLTLDLKEYHINDQQIKRTEKKVGQNTVITYNVSKLDGMNRESGMPGTSFIYPHVLVLSQSFKDESNVEKPLFKETQDLYNWYRSLVEQVEIDPTDVTLKVNELTAGLNSDDDKIKAIYYWVQDNIKYIAFEDGIAGFKPDSPQNVFQKKYGDCKGMAILLKTMLKEAGYDARLVWIGTDAIAYDYSTPSLSVDNHMISAIMVNGEPVFIDGTEKFNKYGTFASRIQGKQALIENGNDFILKKVPKASPETNQEIYQGTFEIKDNDLTAQIKKNISGERASYFLYGFTGMPQDEREDAMLRVLSDGNDNAKVSNVQGFDPNNRDDSIDITYDLVINNVVSNFDDSLYLELDPVRYMSNWKMENDRKHSYQFTHTRSEKKTLQLKLPEGYSIESLPEAISIENEYLTVKASYINNNGMITYESIMTLKKRLIEKENFDLWNNTIEQVKNFYDEQIVLKKV